MTEKLKLSRLRASRKRVQMTMSSSGPVPRSHDPPTHASVGANYEKNCNEGMAGKVTDLANDGDREFGAGSSKGGAFLAAAIDDQVPWLHLDVAYTAIDGPMGSPVPALCHLLLASG